MQRAIAERNSLISEKWRNGHLLRRMYWRIFQLQRQVIFGDSKKTWHKINKTHEASPKTNAIISDI